ncbi:MAG: FAD-dependent oxidoreductase [Proteobacteria bacterium]|nr:FAD-dependent oxidoreductase [Pseudomonadota bacterium]
MAGTSQTSSKSSATRAAGARPRVAIIGAGVCGLGIGWRLAQAGCAVDVFDKGAAGRGATWASTWGEAGSSAINRGMLRPGARPAAVASWSPTTAS